ncbi:hypothetical protein ASE67_02860 [Sphingomonas sp. Leaf23]|uniref:hypothetical protein n=1 Tax=Sphingomonas sp. Leaf23 TaxID=1735689 RepID=UPI0006F66F55|nr:hypothetical protein [Sphingomonas sp. Leaf23]KQM88693.1 hypothetical protein ASE67_02860 [Sphingomonas sp. Leaf23]
MSASGRVRDVLWRRVGDNALRLIAALPVGYAVASLWSMALARILPGDPVQATVAAALIALVLCALAAMWAYAARSGWRALWTLVLAGTVAGGICWGSVAIWGRL